MERLMKTLFEMFANREFRVLYEEQQFVCLPHYDLLLSLAPVYLQKKELEDFNNATSKLVKNYLEELYSDVSKYCTMYDYRNTGKDADWGNSKDSIERAIAFLTSRN